MGQGNIIGKPNLPATTSAKGVWNLREQNTANRAGSWPGYDPQWSNTTLLMKTGPGQVATDTSAYSTYGTPTFSQSDVPYAGIGLGSVTIDTGSAQESVYVTGASMAVGNGNFTVEAWVRYQNFTGGVVATSRWAGNQSNIYWYLGVTTGGRPLFLTRSNGFYTDYGANSTTNVLSTGVWYHMAGVRENNVLKLYINGVLQNVTQSDGGVDLTEQSVSVGFFNYSGYTAGSNATISGFRLTRGAVYTANFTPPTTKPVALANNILLLNFDGSSGTFTDATSKNNLASTATVVTTPALFDGTAASFSGSTSITTTATSGNTLAGNFAFGTGDFTIEAWIYPTSASGDRCIFSTRGSDATAVYFGMYTNTYNLGFVTASAWIVTSTVAAPANAWSHVACVRSSGVVYLYLNGVCVGSAANTTNITDSVGTVGRSTGNNNFTFIGQMDEVRVTKAARYNGTFTPIGPFDRDWEPLYNDTLVTSNVLQVKSIDLPGATNNVFRDDSTNNFLPVRVGDTTQGSFSPYIPSGYWSNHFDGNGDFLSRAGNNIVNFGSSNFTVEAWVSLNAMPTSDAWPTNWSSHMVVVECGSVNAGDGNAFIIGQTKLIFHSNDTPYLSANHGMVPGRWYHIAMSRSGNTLSFFVNGTAIGTAAFSGSVGTGADTYIGCETSQGAWFNGHISNLRVVNGTALYTSAFTPPTTPLTAVANTSLLTCQDNRFRDNSNNNFALTRNGDVSVSRFDPFPLAVPVTTVATTNPGSVTLDGTGDLRLPVSSVVSPGTGDFTAECWVYMTGTSESNGILQISSSAYFNGTDGLAVQCYGSGLTWYIYQNGTITAGTTAVLNRWYHVAVVRGSGTTKLYVDGVAVITTADTRNYTGTYMGIGSIYAINNNYRFRGTISDFRYVKGTAVYTANFTPPTAPLTAISGTVVLTGQDAATITDSSTNNFAITRTGNIQSTDLTPFSALPKRATYAYGGSGYFDGSGDYLSIPNNVAFSFGAPSGNANDFTVEFWTFPTTTTVTAPVHTTYSGNNFWGFAFNKDDSNANVVGMTNFFLTDSFRVQSASGALRANEWSHIAATRSGTTVRLFINGTQVASGTSSINPAPTGALQFGRDTVLGRDYAGYIANARIVKGTAVYTANFTPPTSPVTAISGTSLLLNFDNAGVYDATGSQNLVTRGNTVTGTTTRKNELSATYFDGTANVGLYSPTLPLYGFGTGDFTIEFWVYRNDSTTAVFYDQRPGSTNGAYPTIYVEGNTLYYYVNSGNQINGGTLAAATWHHIAVSRSSSQTRMFVNGGQVGATFADTVSYLSSRPMIGSNGAWGDARLNGHIEGVRVSRVGRYVANFTVPSEPFPVA